jgi:hypothetical protein
MVHLLVSEQYGFHNAHCNNKNYHEISLLELALNILLTENMTSKCRFQYFNTYAFNIPNLFNC